MGLVSRVASLYKTFSWSAMKQVILKKFFIVITVLCVLTVLWTFSTILGDNKALKDVKSRTHKEKLNQKVLLAYPVKAKSAGADKSQIQARPHKHQGVPGHSAEKNVSPEESETRRPLDPYGEKNNALIHSVDDMRFKEERSPEQHEELLVTDNTVKSNTSPEVNFRPTLEDIEKTDTLPIYDIAEDDMELGSPEDNSEKIVLTQPVKMKPDGLKQVYVMSMVYSGQQGAGMNALTSLQCWAGHTLLPNVTIVEPAILKTQLVTSLDDSKADATKLADFFDLDYLNKVSRSSGYATVTPIADYFKQPPTNVIVIRSTNGEKVKWSSNGTCYQTTTSRVLHQLRHLGHCIVKVVETKVNHLTREKLLETIGEWAHSRITLVFSRWNGPWAVFPECQGVGKDIVKTHLQPSQRLLQDARRYQDLYIGDNSNYVALMIRFEHVVDFARRRINSETVNSCLRDAEHTMSELKSSQEAVPALTSDIGSYGSNSFHWFLHNYENLTADTNNIKLMISRLLNHRMSFEEWEGSYVKVANGVKNKGYVAALQRVVASQARCLVLLGGGNFQNLALQDYLRLHTEREKQCIRMICDIKERQIKGLL